jgi:hypothetical protein
VLNEPLEVGSAAQVKATIFHVPNFPDYRGEAIHSRTTGVCWCGRVVLQDSGWRVTLDSDENLSELVKSMKSEGGYAITHVGCLERLDGQEFAPLSGDEVLQALGFFLSFARAAWSFPQLSVGIDARGNHLREQWIACHATSWPRVEPWWCPHDREGLINAFPGFFGRWRDPNWKEPVAMAIHWYLAAQMQHGSIEGSLILLQATLEMLASVILLEEGNLLSTTAFKKMDAVDKIRRLLTECGIPTHVPPTRADLVATATAQGWTDGPQCLTDLRNALIHPKIQNRQKLSAAPPPARFDAWKLGLWYVELVLLRWFGYQGKSFQSTR